MRRLAQTELLELWEHTLALSVAEQPLAFARAACPSATREQLADLPLGERDALLMALRVHNFGARVEAVAACPDCSEMLELTLDLRELAAVQPKLIADRRLTVGDVKVEYRLLSTLDLLDIAAEPDRMRARQRLIGAAVVAADRRGEPITTEALSIEVVEALEEQLERDDPLSDVCIAVRCPVCERAFSAPFDITRFLVAELSTHAQRLLDEVTTLASAYAWSERDILALSPWRRRAYLERAQR
jgi:hypothetical protein